MIQLFNDRAILLPFGKQATEALRKPRSENRADADLVLSRHLVPIESQAALMVRLMVREPEPWPTPLILIIKLTPLKSQHFKKLIIQLIAQHLSHPLYPRSA